jgi:hypothetical protein
MTSITLDAESESDKINIEFVKKLLVLQDYYHKVIHCNNHITRIEEEMLREITEIDTISQTAYQLLELVKHKTNTLKARTTQELNYIKIFYEDQKKKFNEEKNNIKDQCLISIIESDQLVNWNKMSDIILNDSNIVATLNSLKPLEESVDEMMSKLKIIIEKVIIKSFH